MELNTSNWKPFVYGDLFEIKKGKRLTKENYIDGCIPFIGSTETNNGITAYIGNDKHLHLPKVISVTYNGSIAESFYQSKPFWASDDVNILYPKFNINSSIALFLCTIINKEKYRFNYGRKWFSERMLSSVIKLPSINEKPDWKWIEYYVNNYLIPQLPLNAKSIWTNSFKPLAINSNNLKLILNKWKAFRYDEVFKIENGYYNKKPEKVEIGNTPFIGATEYNNGITDYFSINEIENNHKDERSNGHDIEQKIFKGNCITVSNNGSVGFAFYQMNDFTCSHDVNVLYLINHEWNKYLAMFICTLIEKEKYRWAYGRKWRPSRMPSSIIKLPIKNDNTPDWQFMEDYIKSLPYSSSL